MEDLPTAYVRAPAGSRLHVSWHLGNKLSILSLDSVDVFATTAQW